MRYAVSNRLGGDGLQSSKAELKRKGVTYAQLVAKLAAIGVHETERNLNNKISRGGFTAAFLVECMEAVGAERIDLGK